MKTFVASIAFLAFAAPAFAGGMGCGYDATAKMSVKQEAQQLASAETLKLVDGKRLALV
jgi:hypothetical protein